MSNNNNNTFQQVILRTLTRTIPTITTQSLLIGPSDNYNYHYHNSLESRSSVSDQTVQFDTSKLYQFSLGPLIILSILYGMISLTSIIGNGCVIYIILSRPRMRTITNYFLLNLAFADMAIGVFSVPFQFQAALLQRWAVPKFLCPVAPFVQTLCVNVSALTLTAIALDRWSAVLRPLKTRLLTRNKAKLVMSSFWILALFSSFPSAMYQKIMIEEYPTISQSASYFHSPSSGNQQHSISTLSVIVLTENPISPSPFNNNNNSSQGGIEFEKSKNQDIAQLSYSPSPNKLIICEQRWPSDRARKYYAIYLSLIQYFFPFTFILGVYTHIAYRIWGRKAPGHAMNVRDNLINKNKKKVIKMLLIVVGMFGFCWLPLQSYNIFSEIFIAINEYQYINIIWFCCHWIAMSNCCVNPFVYGLYNKKFKSEFLRIYKRALGRRVPSTKSKSTFLLRNKSHTRSFYDDE